MVSSLLTGFAGWVMVFVSIGVLNAARRGVTPWWAIGGWSVFGMIGLALALESPDPPMPLAVAMAGAAVMLWFLRRDLQRAVARSE